VKDNDDSAVVFSRGCISISTSGSCKGTKYITFCAFVIMSFTILET